MTTLADGLHAVTEDAPAPVLGEHIARLMAAKLLGRGDTSESVREYGASRPEFAYMWDAVADAMDAITAVPAQRTGDDEGPDPDKCVLCSNTGPGCPYHGETP
jgi:hypothetical protein